MRVLVVLGHPNAGQSFNRAIAETAVATLREMGHTVVLNDLYAKGFDPVLPYGEEKLSLEELPAEIQEEIAAVRSCDGMVIVHPNWWGTPPALLKGWLDRVFRVGFAYSFSAEGVKQGFTEKTVQVFSTSNTPREVELNLYHDPLENFWGTIVFGLTGCRSYERRNFEPIILSDEAQRTEWLGEVASTLRRRFCQ